MSSAKTSDADRRIVLVPLEVDLIADGGRHRLDLRRAEAAAARPVVVQLGRLRRRDELHFREAVNEANPGLETLVSRLRLLWRLLRRRLPLLARRVGAPLEVDGVPELLVDELARVVVDADDAAAFGQQRLAGLGELVLGRLLFFEAGQVGAQNVVEVIEVEGAAVVAGLAVEADMFAGVEVDAHAPLLHGAVALRPPRAARLAVAGGGLAEDALHVVAALALAAVELGHALVPAERRQVHRRAGLDAVPIGVKPDLMSLQGGDDVVALRRSRVRAFSPTTLNVALMCSRVRKSARCRAASSSAGRR